MPIRGRGLPPASHTPRPAKNIPIKSYRTLSTFRNSSLALSLLHRIGQTVAPLMRKHGWDLPLLSEFLPSNPNLLGINVNRGARISLRLRWHTSGEQLIDEEQVTLVMLHELVHNVHGPHDERFCALLDKVTQEYHEAKRSGRWEGEGFMSAGRTLGAKPRNAVHVGVARGAKLTAASQRLGGASEAGRRESVEARRKRTA